MPAGTNLYEHNDLDGRIPSDELPVAPVRTAVADFDGDGRADVLLVDRRGVGLLLHNEGDATTAKFAAKPIKGKFADVRQLAAGIRAGRVFAKALTLEYVPRFILEEVNSEGERMLRSGELAGLAGVSKDTLRHYERMGVLDAPRRTDSGYRLYPESALRRVRIVRSALDLGISLRDLADIFAMREAGTPPCEEIRKLANKRLAAVEKQIDALTALRDQLRSVVQDWDRRLEGRGPGEPAYLLESLLPQPEES
ncbi:MAG TPA: MerR family transcriptional regulator [Fimbriimonadaceae bacterium]|nr:MerR family transcriptional regulator [Fimbriimonadaceae bacterium]